MTIATTSCSQVASLLLSIYLYDIAQSVLFKMSAQDMRDMLGLTGEVARPAKKRKVLEKRPCQSVQQETWWSDD